MRRSEGCPSRKEPQLFIRLTKYKAKHGRLGKFEFTTSPLIRHIGVRQHLGQQILQHSVGRDPVNFLVKPANHIDRHFVPVRYIRPEYCATVVKNERGRDGGEIRAVQNFVPFRLYSQASGLAWRGRPQRSGTGPSHRLRSAGRVPRPIRTRFSGRLQVFL